MWIQSLGQEDPLQKEMVHSSILAGKSHGQRSLAGYSPWGHKELDMTEWLTLSLKSHWIEEGRWENKLLEVIVLFKMAITNSDQNLDFLILDLKQLPGICFVEKGRSSWHSWNSKRIFIWLFWINSTLIINAALTFLKLKVIDSIY